jgi:tetratricopeptide (TPR) repeat protein
VAAFLYYDGKYGDCERLLEEADIVYTEVLGGEGLDTLGNITVLLAMAYSALGRLHRAVELWERVLEARQRILGHEHPDTLNTMNNLASSYWNLRRTKDAAELGEKVLEARHRILGHEHTDTLITMHALLPYWKLALTKEAAQMQVKDVDAFQRIRGDNHVYTLIAMGSLVEYYKELGRKEEAAQLEGVLNARKHEI